MEKTRSPSPRLRLAAKRWQQFYNQPKSNMMKSLKFILFLLIGILICCTKKKQDLTQKNISNDSVIVYTVEDFYKTKSKKKKIVDTLCAFEEKQAKENIQNGQLNYTCIYGLGLYDYSNKEMGELLSHYSIKLDSVMNGCDRPPKGFRRNCYEEIMNSAILKKFGKNFIDSLRNVADKQFVENHPTYIFNHFECDLTSRYANSKTYSDFLDKPENDFISGLKLKGTKKKEKANTEISFVIYRNGKTGKIKAKSDFDMATNKEFAIYFEEKAIDFVKKSKWIAAKYRGIDVNSEMILNLYNK
jgi:hypothetical protein